MAVTTKNSRNLGIDFMRILSMLFVIMAHMNGQGGLLGHAEAGSAKYWVLSFVQILTICCVNLYGLTTGYLMWDKPFRLSRVVKLWVTTVFWSVAVSCVLFAVFPETRTFEEAVSMFLPILRGRYWFFTAYWVTMLVSPALNLVIRNLSRGQFRLLLAVLFLVFGVVPVCSLGNDVMRISGGSHFSWMIALYLIGGYIRMHCPQNRDKGSSRKYLLGYFLFAAVHMLYIFAAQRVGLGKWSNLFLSMPSPFIVGESICLFLFFRDAGATIAAEGIAGKLIRFAAPGVYSVYVIHVHPKVFWNSHIIALFRAWDNWNLLAVCVAMIGTAVALFVVCVCLDALRQRFFRGMGIDRTLENLSNRVENKVRSLLGD